MNFEIFLTLTKFKVPLFSLQFNIFPSLLLGNKHYQQEILMVQSKCWNLELCTISQYILDSKKIFY